ncbi:unnamed protein product [Oikopleura dioica]|nr:unnamed protein product [Oikopleura dioica]
MNLRKSKEDLKKLSHQKKEEEERIDRNEKEIEDLKKSISRSKKRIAVNQNEIGVLSKRKQELDEDYDAASKRMNLLSFEYFDVAKENIKKHYDESDKCPVCSKVYQKDAQDQKCTLECGHTACFQCLAIMVDYAEAHREEFHEDGFYACAQCRARCPKCQEIFSQRDIIQLYD